MIRLLVLYSAGDRDASPRIRAAARGLAGLRGLIVVKGSGRLEAIGDNAEPGPAVELGFESVESMRAALATEAWSIWIVFALVPAWSAASEAWAEASCCFADAT